jgi:4-amino-4-deoxy-L-arabinose transferase-like glycosyltransferase
MKALQAGLSTSIRFGLSGSVSLLGAIGVWLGWLSWLRPLMLPDEGRYAGVAWDMYRSGTVAVPLINGMPYFHKPPLYYWLTEIGYTVFGLNEWSARLPSLLAAWAAIAAIYFFLLRYRDAATARLAAMVLATMPLFYGGAQFANMDMLVAGTIALATLAGAAAVLEQRAGRPYKRIMLACGAFAALALLAKGLIGVVLPALILLAWVMASRQRQSLRVLLWPPAILMFLAIGAPWFVWMQLRYPGFFHYFFVYQHFQRFAESGFNNVQPFWFYPPVLVGLTLPWALWAGGILRKDFWAPSPARDIRLLMAVWIVVVVGFFSLPSSKLIGYVVPAVPPLAVLLTEVLMRTMGSPSRMARRAMDATLAASILVCVIAVLATAIYSKRSAQPLIARYSEQIGPRDTMVALHSYPFDLAFYARLENPMWIVDDWDNAEIPVRDTWRKELYDAALFEPTVGADVLVRTPALNARLCAAAPGVFWFWGNPGDAQYYDVIKNVSPTAGDLRRSLWRVPVDGAFKAAHCGPTAK